jgi:hypothetical protein
MHYILQAHTLRMEKCPAFTQTFFSLFERVLYGEYIEYKAGFR